MKKVSGRQFAHTLVWVLLHFLTGWRGVGALPAQTLSRGGDFFTVLSQFLEKNQPDSVLSAIARTEGLETLPAAEQASLLLLRGKAWQAKWAREQAGADFHHAINLLQGCTDPLKDSLYAEACLLLGMAYAKTSEYDSAFTWEGRALELYRNLYGSNSLETAKVLNIYAGLFAGCSDYKTSITLRLEGLRIAEAHPNAALQRLRFCNNLDLLYNEGGDKEAAGRYFLRAVSYAQNLNDPWLLAVVQDNYAVFLYENRQFEQADDYLAASGAYYAGVQDTAALYDHFKALGLCFAQKNRPDSALHYHRMRLVALEKRGQYDVTLRAHTLADLADAYRRKGDYEQAFQYWQETVEIEQTEFGSYFSLLYKGYRWQGLCQKNLGRPEAARALFDKSLAANRYDGRTVASVYHPIEAAKTLLEAGRLCLETRRLDMGLRYLQMADTALYMQRKWLEDDFSNLHFAELSAELCDWGLRICMELYAQRGYDVRYAEAALQFMEHTKAIELSAAAGNLQEGMQYGVQKDLLARENALRQQLRSAIARETHSKANAQTSEDALRHILGIKDSLSALQETYRRDYPNYFLYKYAQPHISAKTLVQDCRRQTRAYVSYFQGEEHLYLIAADSAGLFFFRRDISRAGLSALADSLYQAISVCPAVLSDVEVEASAHRYVEAGTRLYDLVLQPVQSVFRENIPLVLSPHADLYRVPFEVLLENRPDPERLARFHTYPYAVKNRRFSYTFSLSLLQLLESKEIAPTGNLLGVMPVSDSATAAHAPRRNIVGQQAEIMRIGAEEKNYLIKRRPDLRLTGEYPSKKEILQLMTQYRIVHILTHGDIASPDSPDAGLLLTATGEYARLWEIYALQMQADLVALSACGANLGQLHQTEGVLSLSRGFLYAGAKSVMSTLWSAPDLESGRVVIRFYESLFAGSAKDAALADAKRAYLLGFRGLSAHPYYWGAYTVWGDAKAVF